jgi:hypothetical protein
MFASESSADLCQRSNEPANHWYGKKYKMRRAAELLSYTEDV